MQLQPVFVALAISATAFAEGAQTTDRSLKIDAVNGKITLLHRQAGSVGAAAAREIVNEYKIQPGLPIESFRPNDFVVFTEAQAGGVWTVANMQGQ